MSAEEIMSRARLLPADDRAAFVRDACAGDSALFVRIMQDIDTRQVWPQGEPDEVPEPVDSFVPGDRTIGPYRIIRSLGCGGMGEVFLAERDDAQFQQQVAIKLVRHGVLSRQMRGRLKLERQILATLDHPNIARLFDGGTTADGTPYIVMEYIDGEPIDDYCNRRELPIEERLRLFQKVCSAVHRAHQNLIVHRDLKPSNILVTADGTPKLLDFGIAKILDDRQLMHTMAVTQADYRLLTPDHASPEQIRGEPVTTSSDIYVLGVLLYELLCGFRAHPLHGNRLADLERAITETTPLTPSAAIAAAQESCVADVEAIASERSTRAARLRRQLSGDLDNIVLMALRKEPQRRYSSAEQLAADIDRYLRGMPVIARADAWTYRAQKFVQRHAAVLGMASLLVVLLVGFTVTTAQQARRIAHERDTANAEREHAQAERERAEAISTFLIDSFRKADPSNSRGEEITAREILDNGARRVSNELGAQPALQATLLDTIGSVYLSLSLHADAQPLIERGLSIRRSLFGERSLDVAGSLYNLNRVYQQKGDLSQAEKLAQESLDITRSVTSDDSLETATSLCRLGSIRQSQWQLDAARGLFADCLRIRIRHLGPNHELVSVPLDNLARIAQVQGNFAEAEKLYRRALLIDEQTHGENHPWYIRHVTNLATALHEEGDLKQAGPLYREALSLSRRVNGDTHFDTLDIMANYGRYQADSGQFDDARKTFEEVLRLNRKYRGPEQEQVGYTLEALGALAQKQHHLPQAERYFREALGIYRKTLPAGHAYTAAAATKLGRVLVDEGNPAAAESILSDAVAAWSLPQNDPSSSYRAVAMATLGRALALQGKYAQAESHFIAAYPVLRSSSRDQATAMDARHWIEDLYRDMGQRDAAEAYFTRVDATR
jgi:serine/threonine protein kinase/Tfp pilus assembly protein PilF